MKTEKRRTKQDYRQALQRTQQKLEDTRQELLATQQREQALAAQVEILKDALEDITQAAQQEGLQLSGWQEQVDKAVSAMLSSPAITLTKRTQNDRPA